MPKQNEVVEPETDRMGDWVTKDTLQQWSQSINMDLDAVENHIQECIRLPGHWRIALDADNGNGKDEYLTLTEGATFLLFCPCP